MRGFGLVLLGAHAAYTVAGYCFLPGVFPGNRSCRGATGSLAGASHLGMRTLLAVIVWGAFWALMAKTAHFSVGIAFGAWMSGYVACWVVRWSGGRSYARGLAALAGAVFSVSPYWGLII